MGLVDWSIPQSPGGDCGQILVIEDYLIACRERTPGLMAHQCEVAGVVEELMDVSHLGSQEGALGCAIYVPKKIQCDGTGQNGGKPSGSLFCAYGLLKHLNHLVPLNFSGCPHSDGRTIFHQDYSPSGRSFSNLDIRFFAICLACRSIRHKNSLTGEVRRNHHMTLTPFREGLQVQLLAGLWLLVFSALFMGRSFQLQWRDRAGLSPASLFSPVLSGQPNNFSRLLTGTQPTG